MVQLWPKHSPNSIIILLNRIEYALVSFQLPPSILETRQKNRWILFSFIWVWWSGNVRADERGRLSDAGQKHNSNQAFSIRFNHYVFHGMASNEWRAIKTHRPCMVSALFVWTQTSIRREWVSDWRTQSIQISNEQFLYSNEPAICAADGNGTPNLAIKLPSTFFLFAFSLSVCVMTECVCGEMAIGGIMWQEQQQMYL